MTNTPDIPENLPLANLAAVVAGATPLREGDAGTTSAAETTKEHAPMLDVHPAHQAASSWREFFIHIATIVLGLVIAVGLEQTVEYFHHRHELAQLREELRQEREANRKLFQKEVVHWRWEAVELQNNLIVLAYLQKHPGTPDEKLPGVLFWAHLSEAPTQAVWDSAKTSGVTSLMHRDEVEQYETFYTMLRRVNEAREEAVDAMWDASRYEFVDGRLSQLTPKQIDEVLALTEIAMNKHWNEGLSISNTAEEYKDFPAAPAELDHLRHRRDFKSKDEAMRDPAVASTMSRLKAVGYPDLH